MADPASLAILIEERRAAFETLTTARDAHEVTVARANSEVQFATARVEVAIARLNAFDLALEALHVVQSR